MAVRTLTVTTRTLKESELFKSIATDYPEGTLMADIQIGGKAKDKIICDPSGVVLTPNKLPPEEQAVLTAALAMLGTK